MGGEESTGKKKISQEQRLLKADVSQHTVHRHQVGCSDLSATLEQAEDGAAVQLCEEQQPPQHHLVLVVICSSSSSSS